MIDAQMEHYTKKHYSINLKRKEKTTNVNAISITLIIKFTTRNNNH